ncbi:MAG TPA: NUMOD4 domain-containing protein [Chitinophagales bacterium]|nr:NUMOD4 domain-containing protein [Cyclobacteriaceae bacterium]HMY34615.1 NUMOD4 domain-containing protein [bacterium]HNI55679.1 NUMOD4 domain-containing protein [Chitinophagales bacterium]HMY95684.1 NUMOD4 domain-containing protein [Cyclobacteriaceae bacterium]HNA14611.1 NUMOD4 domain-containing protein [Cyclobacteriaceae bacterium]
MNQIWKEISGYEGLYEVSNDGRVRSLDRWVTHPYGMALKRGRILAAATIWSGYKRVLLIKDSIRKNITVHRLVALAFVENPNNETQVNHIDGNKENNSFLNLEWCSIGYNNRHARNTGLNVARFGKESHSYGFKNKRSHALRNIETNEIKPIVEVAKEYPQWSRRYITMMIMGGRGNKTKYVLHI